MKNKSNYVYLTLITVFSLMAYWIFDSYWSVISYKANLTYLIHNPPLTLLDTMTFNVPPYQATDRIVILCIIALMGLSTAVILITRDSMLAKIKRIEEEKARLIELSQRDKRMRTVGIMAGGVAHDLNNVLSGVTTYPEMLLLNMDKDDPMYGPLTTILHAGQKSADIVKDLSTLSKGSVSHEHIVDVNYLIREFVSSQTLIDHLPRHKYIKVIPIYSKKPVYIKGSSTHIYKIIMNLTLNAMNSIEDDIGLVRIITDVVTLSKPLDKYIDVRKGKYVKLTVEDTGRGISEEDLDHIFEPFYTKNTLGINGSGTGLGLTIVWAAVHEHAGYISVDSNTTGSTFNIYLPLDENAYMKKTPVIKIEKHLGAKERVLIVDDNKTQIRILGTLLKTLNYDVAAANSGEEAIGILKTGKEFDLIILDVLMPPGMNGCDTFREIKKINPEQKAIIASGYIDSSKVKSAMKLGIRYFIHKPYTINEISEKIKTTLTNDN